MLEWALDRPGADLDKALELAADANLSYQDMLVGLIAGVATEMGELWHNDEVSFLDVTLGAGRLQQALHHIGRPNVTPSHPQRRVLVTTVPGEQHTLGAVLTERLLEAEGVDAVLDIRGSRPVDPQAAIGFDLVAISTPCHRNTGILSGMVGALRDGSTPASPTILLGGSCGCPDLAERVGADGFAGSVSELLASFGDRTTA